MTSGNEVRPWRLLRTGFDLPAFNLACDEALLRTGEGSPALLYSSETRGPRPCLGRPHRERLAPYG